MKRQILGILSATLAAPYLAILGWSIFALLFGDEVGLETPLDLLKAIPIGTLALLFFGIPILILASIMATLLSAFDCRSEWSSMLGGMLVGLFLILAMLFSDFERSDDSLFVWLTSVLTHFASISLLLTGSISGAICGWIYWRIAIKRTPANGHGIEAA